MHGSTTDGRCGFPATACRDCHFRLYRFGSWLYCSCKRPFGRDEAIGTDFGSTEAAQSSWKNEMAIGTKAFWLFAFLALVAFSGSQGQARHHADVVVGSETD